jgi:hypothetical protein
MVCPQGQTYQVCPAFKLSKEIRAAPLTAINEERFFLRKSQAFST